LSETWLSDNTNTSDLLFPSYHEPIRKDRPFDSHGGVILYIKDTIGFRRRLDLEVNGLESIWVELKLCNNKPILFGLFYRPRNSQIEDFINLAVNSGISDKIITGDFNLNTQASSSCKKV